MSKSKKNKINPEEVLEDINKIIGMFDTFKNTNIENIDSKKFKKDMKDLSLEIHKKYNKKNLDFEE